MTVGLLGKLETPHIIVIAVFGLVFLVVLAVIGRYLKLWIQAYFSGASITMFELIGMQLRKVNVKMIVLSRIRAVQAGLDVSYPQMESHYLAGGSVPNVVTAMALAAKANIPMDWETATALDLAGEDVVDVARNSLKQDFNDYIRFKNRAKETARLQEEGAEADA